MRILLVGPGLSGDGVSVVVFTLYQSLIKAGHLCDVAVMQQPAPLAPQYQQLLANGSHLFVLPRLSKQGPISFFKSIQKICQDTKYDVIHIHTGPFIWLSAWAAKKANVPVRVGHAHGERFGKWYSWPLMRMLGPIFQFLNRKYCTRLVSCSTRSAHATFGSNAMLLQNYILPETLTTVPMADIIRKRQELIKDEKAVVFGYIGALYKGKRVLNLPPIIKHLRQKGCNAYLIIIGNGLQYQHLAQLIRRLHLEKYILMLGYRTDTRLLVQTFDYYISASVSEGMSMSMIEAQLSGKPCFVSTRIPTHSDLQIGLFKSIHGENSQHWANRIVQEIRGGFTPIPREEAILRANSKGFSEEKIVNSLIQLYQQK